ncbi:Cysteine-rich protein 2 [Merluccius polli]|uniref:Cysteine-rich protein 2 n=1 Tax=Merluccius polli TaxID=89951 RepID=A0AA47MWK1_MERPO|nr:Cysteine-rich protein 2 [Merluccius polli]
MTSSSSVGYVSPLWLAVSGHSGFNDAGAMEPEKVSSLGKEWHKLCLKCDRCNKLLTAGGHAELSVEVSPEQDA